MFFRIAFSGLSPDLTKVPFMLIAGEDDVTKDAVSFRYRDGTQENGVPVDEAVEKVVAAVESRA